MIIVTICYIITFYISDYLYFQIYFQGSGRDCRLHVQQLNAIKANNTFFIPSEEDDVEDTCDALTNIRQESDSDQAAENKWTKYSSETENVEDLVFDKKTDNLTPSKKPSYNNINKNLLSFGKYLDDTDSESEDVNNETEGLCFMSFNHNSNNDVNSNNDDKCNMQDNIKSNGDCNNTTNIFETYDELDDPLDF